MNLIRLESAARLKTLMLAGKYLCSHSIAFPQQSRFTMRTCRVCNGPGKFLDLFGHCCTSNLDAQGLCCGGEVDSCGVCQGNNSCPFVLSLVLSSTQFGNITLLPNSPFPDPTNIESFSIIQLAKTEVQRRIGGAATWIDATGLKVEFESLVDLKLSNTTVVQVVLQIQGSHASNSDIFASMSGTLYLEGVPLTLHGISYLDRTPG